MTLIIVLVVVLLLFGGGFGYYNGRGNNFYGAGPVGFGGGIIGLLVLVFVLMWLFGGLRFR
jgi:hypothetical protein